MKLITWIKNIFCDHDVKMVDTVCGSGRTWTTFYCRKCKRSWGYNISGEYNFSHLLDKKVLFKTAGTVLSDEDKLAEIRITHEDDVFYGKK